MTRKMMITAAVAVLAFPAMASAQGQNSSVSATATVADYMDMTGVDNLNFGTLSRTAANTISATDNSVTRTVVYNRNIRVAFSNVPTELTGTNVANTLAVSLVCSYLAGATWTSAACSAGPIDLDVGAGTTTTTLGFGGTITSAAAAAAVADTYSATMDIVVSARN